MTTSGLYNFYGAIPKRFIPIEMVEGLIFSSVSDEIIIHVPCEYDYHYLIEGMIREFIYYVYVAKQYQNCEKVELVLLKTVRFFFGIYGFRRFLSSQSMCRRKESLSWAHLKRSRTYNMIRKRCHIRSDFRFLGIFFSKLKEIFCGIYTSINSQ